MRYRNSGGIIQPGINITNAPNVSGYSYTYYALSWGTNSGGTVGELGLGAASAYYSSPKQIGALTDWATLSVARSMRLSTKTDGTLWTWGWNDYGQLGLGNSGAGTNRSSPTQIGSLTSWLTAVAGYRYALAIGTNGTLWSWGRNDNYGMLALGNNTNYSSPKQVGALTNWSSIAAGSIAAAFAIKTDGTLWTWGAPSYYGPFGQLGLGNNTSYSSPKQVGALTNWLKITNSYSHALAIKTNGTLWAWGYNATGMLGLGNITSYSSPIQVGALTNWSNTATGNQTSFGIRADGTLWAWGSAGSNSRLGLNNLTYYSSPKQVGALTNWLNLSTFSNGGNCCFAIKTNGTLWGWGPQNVGQLGVGNVTNYSSPIQVGALTTWKSIGAWTNGTGALQY